MKTIDISINIGFCQQEELSEADQHLIQRAVEATGNSYSPYSRFRVEWYRSYWSQSGECCFSIRLMC